MAGETIEMRLVLKDEASPALEATRTKAITFGGAAAQAARSAAALELELRGIAPSASRAAAQMDQFERASKQGTASTRNMGQSMLELSRGFEDAQYGLKGVMNNIPSLVQSLGGGPGLAGVVSVAAVAVGILADHWARESEEAKKAATASVAAANEIADAIKQRISRADVAFTKRLFGIDDEDAARIKALKGEVGALRLELQSIGALEEPGFVFGLFEDGKVTAARERLKGLTKALGEAESAMATAKRLEGWNGVGTEKQRADEAERMANAQKEALKAMEAQKRLWEESDKRLAELDQPRGLGDALRRQPGAATSAISDAMNPNGGSGTDPYAQQVAAEAADAASAKYLAEKQAAEDLDALKRKLQKDFDEWSLDVAIQAARERAEREKEINDEIWSDAKNLAMSTTSTLSNVAQQYVKAKIAGGKESREAERVAAAAALGDIGSQLVAYGIMQEFKAAALAIESAGLDPRAAALAGVGAAAIAAGFGMGAASAAIAPKSTGGDGARTSSGALTSRSSPASAAPASTNITIVYGGPTGPVAEDVARSTRDALRRNERRGGRGR